MTLIYIENGLLKLKHISTIEESEGFEIYLLTDDCGNAIIDNRKRGV